MVAVGLLAGGTGVALVMRGHTDTTGPRTSIRASHPTKSLGPLPLEVPDEPTQPARLSGKIEADANSAPQAASASSVGEQNGSASAAENPATMSKDYWRPSMKTASYEPGDSKAVAPRQRPPKPKADSTAVSFLLHRIVDGDTLPGLAQRYLGSSKRFTEILDANRDRLQSPDLLPIGAELRIPVTQASDGSSAVGTTNAEPAAAHPRPSLSE
jgi:nucleoid-associated protein YgaU